MHLLTKTLITAASAVAAIAGPATAASPESGSVSKATPEAKWTGEAAGYGISVVNNFQNTAEQVCEAPFCDVYTLQVVDQGDLNVTAFDTDKLGFVQVDVVKPDGTYEYNGGEADKASTIIIRNAPAGTYTVRVLTNSPVGFDASYAATAKLQLPQPDVAVEEPVVPAAPAQPQAQAPAQPAAAPAPTVTIKTRKASARKSRKGLAIALACSGELRNVTVVLKKGAKTAGTAKLATLGSAGTARVKARGLKRGAYTVAVTGTDAAGRTVTASSRLTVTK